VPVILVTGWGDQLDSQQLRESGVDLVVAKPFRVERVLLALTDALALRNFLER
jgi:CheY-like chemotaxis protein